MPIQLPKSHELSQVTPDTKYDWLNPLNRLAIHKAVKAKQDRVTLNDGRIIALDYEKVKGKVHMSPIPTDKHPNPFVPRGYFDLKMVKSVDWIE